MDEQIVRLSATIKCEQADEYLEVRRALSSVAQALSPDISYCKHCRMPWTVVTSHVTQFTHGQGMFPLCRQCWTMLLPEERLPYYISLLASWGENEKLKHFKAVHEAVMSGG